MNLSKIKYLGIDIGGAHLKYVGLDNKGQIKIVKYLPYKIWVTKNDLKKNLKNLYKEVGNKKTICGITMSAELCDIFKNRKEGIKELTKICKTLKFQNFYYTHKKNIFLKIPKANEIMSMNWHAIGRICEKRIKNCIIVDFGSTTTDFICIKDFKFINKHYTDFSRINNDELIYTGVTRTPLFSLASSININKKIYKLIPEFFSETADIYRIKKILYNLIDLDETRDGRGKSMNESKMRVSRNFGFDYDSSKSLIIKKICNELCEIQLSRIKKNITRLKSKFNLPKNTVIALSGIGQDILLKHLLHKKVKAIKLIEILKIKEVNKATFHAPALSIALLLSKVFD